MTDGYDNTQDISKTANVEGGDSVAWRGPEGQYDVESIVDFETLRGWREDRDPALRKPHRLPALTTLIELDDADRPQSSYPIHGPDILVGRSHFRHPPVDLCLHGLQDHQLYRLGTPHARLRADDDGWTLHVLTPRFPTEVDGRSVQHGDPPKPLPDGAIVRLGVTRFRFSTSEFPLARWYRQQRQWLDEFHSPTLMLERRGAPCGPVRELTPQTPLVIGRTHPGPKEFPRTSHWPKKDPHFWDLSGLYDWERTYVAFRHASVEFYNNRWTLRPLSTGYRIFVNGNPISERTELKGGDRIGLGSVVLCYCDPAQPHQRPAPWNVPEVVDWSEGRPPTTSTSEPER